MIVSKCYDLHNDSMDRQTGIIYAIAAAAAVDRPIFWLVSWGDVVDLHVIISIERRSGTGTYLFMFVWQDKIIIFTGSGATLHTHWAAAGRILDWGRRGWVWEEPSYLG